MGTRRLAIVALVLAATVAAAILGLSRGRSDTAARQSAALVEAADRVMAPPGWTLVESLERRSGSLCVDVECPSVSRRWTSTAPISPDQLSRLLEGAGLAGARVEGTCRPQAGRTGAFPLCQARAEGATARMVITVSGVDSSAGPPYAVTLIVTGLGRA